MRDIPSCLNHGMALDQPQAVRSDNQAEQIQRLIGIPERDAAKFVKHGITCDKMYFVTAEFPYFIWWRIKSAVMWLSLAEKVPVCSG